MTGEARDRHRGAALGLRLLAAFLAAHILVALFATLTKTLPAWTFAGHLLFGAGWILFLLRSAKQAVEGRRVAQAAAFLVLYGIVGVGMATVAVGPYIAASGAGDVRLALVAHALVYAVAAALVFRAL